MKTILYIDQNRIQVLQLDRKNKLDSTVELQPGTVLNGVVLEPDKLREALLQLKLKAKKVTLVIDSSNILSKKLVLPKASKPKLHQMVKGEFDLFQTAQQYQYDINILDTSSSATVMGYAVRQDMIESYLQVCNDSGITVARVEFLLNGLINYISSKAQFKGKTFLFNMISGEYLLSILFENGSYKLSNRIRLLHVGAGELFYQELYSRLSAMTQFNSSERSAHTIADSYYIGLSAEDVQQLSRYVDGVLPIKVQSYQDSEWNATRFLPALATYTHKQDINFAIKQQAVVDRSQKRRAVVWKTAILAVLLGVVTAHSLIIFQQYYVACRNHTKAEEMVASEERLEELEQYNTLQQQNAQLSAEIAQYQALADLLDSGAVVEKSALEQIFSGNAVESFSFDVVTGEVYISGVFDSSAKATDYATRLREKGFFVTMDYNGYYSEKTATKDKKTSYKYRFTITAAYAPIAEAPVQEATK